MSRDLINKTTKGVRWSFADNIINQGITFLVGVVLARLLSPDEYGLIGIITIFIALFNSIVDSGFSSALVRKKNADEKDFNTVFHLNMVISIVLCLTMFFGAPLIAKFFERPALTALSKVMSLTIVINAFAIVQRTILTKAVDFKTQAKISVISSIISGIIGIAMAFLNCGVWSLVGQQISRQFLNSVLCWTYNHWRPKLIFSTASFKSLFGFGWKLLVSGLIDTTWTQIYQIVIGKCYSPATLGQYSRAHQFANLFSSNLNGVVQRVSFPVLSSIQDERQRMKEAYRKIIKVTMCVTFPCMIGLAAVAKPLILVLIGEKWLPCVPMLQLICFSMMLYPLHSLNLNMLEVQGRSDLFLKLEIIKKVIGVGPVLLGVFVNIYWMLAGSIIAGIISYFLNSAFSGKLIGYSSWHQIKDVAPTLISSNIMGACVYPVSLLNLSPFISLPIQVILGIFIFVSLCKVLHLEEYNEMRYLITESIGKMRGK